MLRREDSLDRRAHSSPWRSSPGAYAGVAAVREAIDPLVVDGALQDGLNVPDERGRLRHRALPLTNRYVKGDVVERDEILDLRREVGRADNHPGRLGITSSPLERRTSAATDPSAVSSNQPLLSAKPSIGRSGIGLRRHGVRIAALPPQTIRRPRVSVRMSPSGRCAHEGSGIEARAAQRPPTRCADLGR